MKYFYARVSTKEQNLARQLEVAKEYACNEVFCDKQSGKSLARPEYLRMKGILKKGDEVYIKELDRLGRNKSGVKREIEWFRENGIMLRIIEIPTTMIDYKDQGWIGDMINNILIEVLGAVAEQELRKTHMRQREGIDAMPVVDGKRVSAKTGRATGRPDKARSDFEKYFEKQKRGLLTIDECCAALGISKATWYNYRKEAS